MEQRKRIYLCLAHMSEAGLEQKYIKEAFDTNWVVPLGPNVNAFEKDLESFVNCVNNENESFGMELRTKNEDETFGTKTKDEDEKLKKVVALSAGTAAVHLALLACGVGQGDEVCVQSFTFCASSHPITYLGAKPVFIGSERDTWNMDPELLEAAIKDRIAKTGKKPKAIVPVALYGMPYDITRIMEIADCYDIPVIEDAAEGFGSKFDGQVLGTFGRYGVLSFNGNKMITTSGGGALVCSSPEDANKIMWYATQAREAYPYYEHEAIGYNYRMSNICAGIGRGQMTVADDHIAHHKMVQALYRELLKDVLGIHLHEAPVHENDNENENFKVYDSNFWLCTITLDTDLRIKGQEKAYGAAITSAVGGAAGVIHAGGGVHTDCEPNTNVEALRMWMDAAQVEARPVWKPMHKQPVYNMSYENVPLCCENRNEDCVCYEGPKSCAYMSKNEVCEEIFKVGMCLPAGPYVTEEDVRYIVDKIKEAIEE